MALAYQEHYLIDDYEQWEGEWELIDGMPYAMSPAPVTQHQYVATRIAGLLNDRLETCDICYAVAEAEWRAKEDTVFRPDVMVVCEEEMARYVTKRPELIFEVVSPSTAAKDEHLKYALYEKEGVSYYVIVYPDEKMAKVFALKDGRYTKALDAEKETFRFDLGACVIDFDFAKIWG